MLYLFLLGEGHLRELIYLWILFNSKGTKCHMSYIKNDPSLEKKLGFSGVKVFIKNSEEDEIHTIDIKNDVYLVKKPIKLENIEFLYEDIASLL